MISPRLFDFTICIHQFFEGDGILQKREERVQDKERLAGRTGEDLGSKIICHDLGKLDRIRVQRDCA